MTKNMTPEQFCYWLNGFFDLTDSKELNEEQVKVLRSHLDLIFNKQASGIGEKKYSKDIFDLPESLKPKPMC